MLKKSLLSLLGILMFILWPGHQLPAKSPVENATPATTCPELWPVKQGEKWGYIDKTGRLIVPFKYDMAGDFSEGLAAVHLKDKTGYIDKTGKLVIPIRFFSGFPFSSGRALVVFSLYRDKDRLLMNKLGYIDKSGKMVFQRKEALDSRSLRVEHEGLMFSEGFLTFEQNNKVGYLDTAGKVAIPPQYDDASGFSEGLAPVKIDNKYGYIDKSGKMVIPPQFQEATSFSDGLASVTLEGKGSTYVDKSGKVVISGGDFKDDMLFSEGLAPARRNDDKWGFIDKTGKFVIEPQFERVGKFSEGLAPVVPPDGSVGSDLAYINQKGEIVIRGMSTFPNNPSWRERDLHAYLFCGGIAKVSAATPADEDALGYIDHQGRYVWPKVRPSKK